MPLPPKGDPRRPMYMAVRSIRLLGFILITIGGLGLFIALVRAIELRGSPLRRVTPFMVFGVLSGAFLYLAPGVLLLVFATQILKRKAWALVGGIVLTSIMILFLLMVPVTFAMMSLNHGWSPFFLIPMGIAGIFIIALAQLIYLLSKSFHALTYFAPNEARGFEPLPVRPVTEPLNQS